MRKPDRPEPGTFRAHQDNLAERRAWLPDGLPSSAASDRPGEAAYPADSAGVEAGIGPESEGPDQDEAGQRAPSDGRATGAPSAAGGIPDGAASARRPGLPWFADGGQG